MSAFLLLAMVVQQPAAAAAPPPIADNSFLMEEAYNQEPRVVQHINALMRFNGEWAYAFTQEWPVGSQRHQLSYTVPVTTGLGDLAINYRHQLSERDLGRALARFGRRDAVVLTTKGGYLPHDAASGLPPAQYVRRTFVEPGLVRAEDVAGGVHCMAPSFLEDQLSRSLANLGVEAVDVYYVHNPESQLAAGVDRATFEARLVDAFEALERATDAGRIGAYGVATWDGLRVPPEDPAHLGLERLLELAEEARERVGGRGAGTTCARRRRIRPRTRRCSRSARPRST